MCRSERAPVVSASREAQVAENFDDDCGVFDGGEDGQGAATLWTGGQIQRKHPFE